MNLNKTDLERFKKTALLILKENKTPIKRKYIRENEAPFMTNELHKAIMKRSKGKIKHHKEIFVKTC